MTSFHDGELVMLAQPVYTGPGANEQHLCPTSAQLAFIASSIRRPEPYRILRVEDLEPQECRVARHPQVIMLADPNGEVIRSRYVDHKGELIPLVFSGIWFQAA